MEGSHGLPVSVIQGCDESEDDAIAPRRREHWTGTIVIIRRFTTDGRRMRARTRTTVLLRAPVDSCNQQATTGPVLRKQHGISSPLRGEGDAAVIGPRQTEGGTALQQNSRSALPISPRSQILAIYRTLQGSAWPRGPVFFATKAAPLMSGMTIEGRRVTVELYAVTCGHLTIPSAFLLSKTKGVGSPCRCRAYVMVHRRWQVVFDSGMHLRTQNDAARLFWA